MSGITRRDLLELMAGGIAALQAGCLEQAGDREIVPYVVDPPEQRPGVPVRYTGLLARDGFAAGVLVDSNDGRPTKLDGNPLHPATLGGSLPWMQAAILDLYDPQRLRDARLAGDVTTWSALAARLRALPRGPLWLVLPPQTSPTAAALLARIGARRELHVVYHAPLDHRAAYRGAALVYGRPLEAQPDVARADVLVALDADVLAGMPMSAAWARTFAGRRAPDRRMSRLWACEPMPTPTGTLADERVALRAREVVAVATCALVRLGELGLGVPALQRDAIAAASKRLDPGVLAWARALAEDLADHRGAGAVFAGDRQPPIVHALGRWLDAACGNAAPSEPATIDPLGGQTLDDLIEAAGRDRTPAIVVIDANPVATSPHPLALTEALARAPLSLHATRYRDETTAACHALVPLAHELETWSDGRAWTGALAIGQPAIRPRFDIASTLDVLAALAGEPRSARDLVRAQLPDDAHWRDALRTGIVRDSDAPRVTAEPRWTAECDTALARALAPASEEAIEIALAPSLLHDGRHAANAWLQELPHPITKQTWGNAALLGPATAARLGVGNEDVLHVASAVGAVDLPALIVTGAAEGSITLELGYGRRTPEQPIADGVGADAFVLRDDDRRILAGTATPAGGSARIIRTQHETDEQGRGLAPHATLGEFLANPRGLAAHLRGDQPSLLPQISEAGTQWGMSIDTSLCTGCSACMVACQAENNIPSVGPADVANGRHMNWIRIDRWLTSDGAVINEPMPCQHCEHAPCEYVCPVNATVHGADGLNEQIYNRCVGTRFCSNNCPYKVRRFNWFAYEKTDSASLQYNPDVTVRSRGVMEKCTYCVQRIRRAEHAALVEDRAIRAGEVVTACQAACPTTAIVFGDLHEQGTRFAAMRRDPRRFSALFELGTRPRTQYLAKVTNPRSKP
ncbi:MAG TPA: 4Fe-4S dicluster domain-containing protein [Kofleriaceae bacterium]|jgi:molybdopterin-containing oxidoreductase family iron-sulfur binding subunit